MARVFTSHSFRDKDIARRIANDLQELGHRVRLDEWDIQAGECIPTKIEGGLRNAQLVVLLLSRPAVSSTWVAKKWKSAFCDEVQSGSVIIIPALLVKCPIP